jgi:hypothetical protein
MDRYPMTDDPQPEIELWEPESFEPELFERTGPAAQAPVAAGRSNGFFGRMARSTPAAVAGSLLVAAVAFGAVGSALTSTPSDAGADRDGTITLTDEGTGANAGAAATGHDDSDGYGDKGDDGDGDRAATGDQPKDGTPDTTPDDADGDSPMGDAPGDELGVKPMDLALHLNDTYIKVDWTGCDVDGFRYYKVVRSTDATPTWPLGDGDKLVAAIEDPAATVVADGDFGTGKTYHYRVFGLTSDGVACESAIRAIEVPAPAPKPDPEAKDDPKDDPKPDDPGTGALGLSVSIKDGKPYIDWTECSGSFDYYKVIRSTDSTVTWPKGDGDTGVTAVGPDGKTAAWDGDAPAGKKVWYRVFCVIENDGGYKVLAASGAKAVVVPDNEPEPEPDPVELGFEVTLTDDGVKLNWEACGSDVFVAYKVVRSHSPNPSYLPGTDGTQVIGVIENAGTTAFVDGDVEAGQTWYYRVQAIGWMNDHKILLGQTAAKAVTVE